MLRIAVRSFTTALGLGAGAGLLVVVGYAMGLQQSEPLRDENYAEDVRKAAKKLIDLAAARVVEERVQASYDQSFESIVDTIN